MMSTVGSLALRVAICTLCLRLAAGNAAHSLHTVREGTLYERRAARGQSQTDPGPGAVESTIAADSSIQAEFESVYAAKKWGDYGGGSGLGSHPPNTVYAQRTILQVAVLYQIDSMVDAPCGAVAWQPALLEELGRQRPGFRYLGLDVVRTVVAENQRRLAHQPSWSFALGDITQVPVPSGYDLILCRDALQHLPLLSVVDALENFARSDARYLLVGSYMAACGGANHNIQAGGVFSIDLMQAPFGLDAPLMAYNELTHHLLKNKVDLDKHLLLFSIPELRAVDWAAMRERARVFGGHDTLPAMEAMTAYAQRVR